MPRKSDIPTFNMKVVVQETGLTPDTLRAWERRYGMPKPERTEGKHRLYSQHEIDMLKWLIARQQEGLSISNAVDLWRRLESEGQNPLQMTPELAVAQIQVTTTPISGKTLLKLREAWLAACLNFDEYTAQHLLAQAFALFPLETVCFEILQPGLHQIGQGWYEGSVSVQQEHFASTMALRQLEALLASMASVKGRDRLLVACPPREQHTFSLLLLALMFRRRNWHVVYLGANVPVERLESAIQSVKPEMVILGAQTLYTAGTMLEMAHLLRRKQIPLGFGGAVFNKIEGTQRCIPGHFLGGDLQKTPETVELLLQKNPPLPEIREASPAYHETLAHFREKRPAIEAHVYHFVDKNHLGFIALSGANEDLGNSIAGALTLGNMELLTTNVEWVRGLLMNYHYRMPADAVGHYIATYYKATQIHLDERGKPIQEWFERLIAGN